MVRFANEFPDRELFEPNLTRKLHRHWYDRFRGKVSVVSSIGDDGKPFTSKALPALTEHVVSRERVRR